MAAQSDCTPWLADVHSTGLEVGSVEGTVSTGVGDQRAIVRAQSLARVSVVAFAYVNERRYAGRLQNTENRAQRPHKS